MLGRTVAELRQSLGHAELIEWMAYDRLAPFGPEVDDYRGGLGMALLANPNRGTGKKPFKATDFALGSLHEREDRSKIDRSSMNERIKLKLGRLVAKPKEPAP